MSKPLYGHVATKKDITKINISIRKQIRKTRSRAKLTELVRRSLYLCTLTHSPAWKGVGGKKLLPTAKKEYATTAKLANQMLKKKGIKGEPYDTKYGD